MSDAFPVVIFHNPACETSRNTLAMIRASGVEPAVVDYLKTGWLLSQLHDLLALTELTPRQLLREKGTPAAELGLLDSAVPDEAILAAMVEHPVLVNRPIVLTARGARLCRPSERVFALLETPPASFTKEDGEVVRP